MLCPGGGHSCAKAEKGPRGRAGGCALRIWLRTCPGELTRLGPQPLTNPLRGTAQSPEEQSDLTLMFSPLFFFISDGLGAPVLNFLLSICGAAGAMLSGRSPPSLSLRKKKKQNKTKKSHQNQTEKKKHSRSFSFDVLGQHSGCCWPFQSLLPPRCPALGSSA